MQASRLLGHAAWRARYAVLVTTVVAALAGALAPAASAAPTLTLSPGYQEQTVGNSQATVTATLGGVSDPTGQSIQFRVTSGPDAGLTAIRITNASGHATWTFGGTASGRDIVQAAQVTSLGAGPPTSNSVEVDWDNWIFDACGFHHSNCTFSGTIAQGTFALTLNGMFCPGPADNPPVADSSPTTDYTAIWNVGDGSPPVHMTIFPGGAPGCFSGITPVRNWDAGTFTGTITVTDNDTPSNTITEASVITFTGVSVSGVNTAWQDGASATKTVAHINDTDSSATSGEYTASIDWGDGTTSAGTVTGASPPFNVRGTHTYTDDGSFTVTSTVTDTVTGAKFTGTSTATVADRAITVHANGPFSATQGDAFSATVGTFADPNTFATASDYSATVDWGDGTTSAATISGGSGSFGVNASHIYTTAGPHTFTITVHDVDGGQTDKTATGTINVAAGGTISDSSMNISAVEGQNTGTTQVAAFSDTDTSTPASAFTATIHWGDGTTSTGTVSGSGGSFIVSGSHTYTEEGTYSPLFVHIVGPANTIDTSNATATVSDAAIFVSALGGSTTTSDTFSGFIAQLNDDNPFATTADFTATIFWGDGTHSAGTVIGPFAPGLFGVGGTHTYATGGNHAVTVEVQDDGGAFAIGSATIGTGCNSLTPCGPAPFAKGLAPKPAAGLRTITVTHRVHRQHRRGKHRKH